MHDEVRLEAVERLAERIAVADVSFNEAVGRVIVDLGKRGKVTGTGQLVVGSDLIALAHQATHHR